MKCLHPLLKMKLSHSEFKSCTNQVLAITHKIHKLFDKGFKVRGVFLDITKVFGMRVLFLNQNKIVSLVNL